MLRKAITIPILGAAAYVALQAWFRIAGPEVAYYTTTALLLLGIIVGVVLVFVVIAHLAVRLFGWAFQGALRRSYILFLGWNLLRSHRMVTVFSVRAGDWLHRFLPPGRHLVRDSALALVTALALIPTGVLLLPYADPAQPIAAAFVELGCASLFIVGVVFALRGLLGFVVRMGWVRRIDVGDQTVSLPMEMRSGVTVPNFISMVGVGIGVWALIMVLSVMSGFEADLRNKILATNAHVVIQPTDDLGPIDGYLDKADRIVGLEGVQEALPFAEGEVMISSPFNTSVNLTVRGITAAHGSTLDMDVIEGDAAFLARPERLLTDAGWEFVRRRDAKEEAPDDAPDDGLIEMPAIPGGAPLLNPEAPTEAIVVPPMPGGEPDAPPASPAAGVPGALISMQMARDLEISVGDVVVAIRRSGDGGDQPTILALQVLGIYRRAKNDVDRPDAYVLPAVLERLRKGGERALVTLTADGDNERPGFVAPLDPALPDVAALSNELVAGAVADVIDRGAPVPGDSPLAKGVRGTGVEPVVRVYPGILLGRELASSLRVEVGNEVRLISPEGEVGPTGVRPKASTFVVAGVFTTGMYEFDLKLAYVQLADAQRFFGMGAELNRIEVRVADPADTDPVVERISAAVGGGLEVLDWKVLNRNLFSALKLEKIAMFFILGFIILVASFNILASLAMLIQEKSTEIAILKSMGATNGGIQRSFLVLGLLLGLIGAFCGVGMGLGLCLLLDRVGIPLPKEYYIEFIPVEVNGLEVAAAVFTALAISLLATIYPSRTASRLHPVEGLRYE